MDKKYLIGETTFIQRPIVLGQLKLLLAALEGVSLHGSTALEVLQSLGGKLPAVLSTILVEEGSGVREAMDRLEERAERIEWHATPEICLEVVEDFFACNPVSSVSEKLGSMLDRMADPSTSNPPFSSSAEATSPNGTVSYGAPKQRLPSDGSNSTFGSESAGT